MNARRFIVPPTLRTRKCPTLAHAPDFRSYRPSFDEDRISRNIENGKQPSNVISTVGPISAAIIRAATYQGRRSTRLSRRRSAQISCNDRARPPLLANCRSVEARGFHRERKWIEPEILRKAIPAKAQPTI